MTPWGPIPAVLRLRQADAARARCGGRNRAWSFQQGDRACLGISPRTVEFHRNNIMRKLGAKNIAEFVRKILAK
jgi:Bacterial regulatory proteins, luxR family